MKRLITIFIIIALGAAIFFILRANKQTLNRQQELSREGIEKVPVQVDTVRERILGPDYSFPAVLEPERQLMVISQTEGRVVDVRFELGDRVGRGMTVVRVEDDLLKANLQVAEAAWEKAKKDLERFERMIEADGVTQDQLEKMRLNEKNTHARVMNLRKRLELTSVTAPFTGYINQLFTREGAVLGTGVPVFDLVNTDAFRITLNLSEKEIIHVHEGMQVSIRPKAIDTIEIAGAITAMARSANRAQQYAVEVTASNPRPDLLKGGMLAQVRLQTGDEEPVRSIRREWLREADGETYVFRVEAGQAIRQPVRVDGGDSDFIRVREGLRPGDVVISTGIDRVEDGTSIRIVNPGTE